MKFLAFCVAALAAFSFSQPAFAVSCTQVKADGRLNNCIALASAVTATGVQAGVTLPPGAKTLQATVSVTSGAAGTAAITIQGTIDDVNWDSLGTLSPAPSDSITMISTAYYKYRVNVTAITGTGASLTINAGN